MVGSVTGADRASEAFKFDVSTKEFLDLFVAEMQNQDPMEPLSNTDMLTQISQITNVQLMTDLAAGIGSLTDQNRVLLASGLLGKTVEYTLPTGLPAFAQVTDVSVDGEGAVELGLDNGNRIGLDDISRVTG